MANQKVRIYPCDDFTSSRSARAALRKVLFGKKMKIFPGGWTFFEMSYLEKAARTPVRASSSKKAFEMGVLFMKKAQGAWAKEKQKTELFPVSSSWKLVPREAVAITTTIDKKEVRIGWRLTWQVFAKTGSTSGLSDPSVKGYITVDNANIVLYVALSGLVLGGNTHWRPVKRGTEVELQLNPSEYKRAIDKARATAESGDDHKHTTNNKKGNSYFSIAYHMGTRSEFRNYVDPYVRYIEAVGHSHGPPAIAPLTEYGVFAEIVKIARKIGTKASIELLPWINTAKGAVSGNSKGITGHWLVQGASDPHTTQPVRHKLGKLTLSGVKEVSLTVKTKIGGISHAHAEICSALPMKPKQPKRKLPSPLVS